MALRKAQGRLKINTKMQPSQEHNLCYAAQVPCTGRCVDNGTTAAFEDQGNLILHAKKNTFQVDIHLAIKFFLGNISQWRSRMFDPALTLRTKK